MNITETFNAKAYAMDAVMTLALALNETLRPTFNGTSTEDLQINKTALKGALQNTMLNGASVSEGREGGRERETETESVNSMLLHLLMHGFCHNNSRHYVVAIVGNYRGSLCRL